MKALIVLFFTCAILLGAETNQLPNRPGLEITSEFAEFRLKDGTYYYSNNVKVIDPPAKAGDPGTILRCRELTATRDEGGKFDTIVAWRFVEIDQGTNHARGDRAVYTRTNEWMTLTGAYNATDTNYPRPYLISAQNTIEADEIIYDRLNNRFQFQKPRTLIAAATLSRGGTNSVTSTNKVQKPNPRSPFPPK